MTEEREDDLKWAIIVECREVWGPEAAKRMTVDFFGSDEPTGKSERDRN